MPLANLIAGFLAGLFVATAGYLKDRNYEPFSPRSFARSPAIGTFGGLVGVWIFSINDLVVLMFFSGAFERLTVEIYKAFFRREPPSKFQRSTKWPFR